MFLTAAEATIISSVVGGGAAGGFVSAIVARAYEDRLLTRRTLREKRANAYESVAIATRDYIRAHRLVELGHHHWLKPVLNIETQRRELAAGNRLRDAVAKARLVGSKDTAKELSAIVEAVSHAKGLKEGESKFRTITDAELRVNAHRINAALSEFWSAAVKEI